LLKLLNNSSSYADVAQWLLYIHLILGRDVALKSLNRDVS